MGKMYPVKYLRIRYSLCTCTGRDGRKSEKWQDLEGCLEIGVLCVLVSPDSWGTEDSFHLQVNPTIGEVTSPVFSMTEWHNLQKKPYHCW